MLLLLLLLTGVLVRNLFHFYALKCITSSTLYLAGSTRVSSADVRAGENLEAESGCRFKRVDRLGSTQLRSVPIRRYTWRCLPCLPGCTCSARVRPDQAAAVSRISTMHPVMLVRGLGLGLRGLALAKNSRPKSWQTTKFTINFHRPEWIIFRDPRSLLP